MMMRSFLYQRYWQTEFRYQNVTKDIPRLTGPILCDSLPITKHRDIPDQKYRRKIGCVTHILFKCMHICAQKTGNSYWWVGITAPVTITNRWKLGIVKKLIAPIKNTPNKVKALCLNWQLKIPFTNTSRKWFRELIEKLAASRCRPHRYSQQ